MMIPQFTGTSSLAPAVMIPVTPAVMIPVNPAVMIPVKPAVMIPVTPAVIIPLLVLTHGSGVVTVLPSAVRPAVIMPAFANVVPNVTTMTNVIHPKIFFKFFNFFPRIF